MRVQSNTSKSLGNHDHLQSFLYLSFTYFVLTTIYFQFCAKFATVEIDQIGLTLQSKTTGNPISGCTCFHHNNNTKSWQLPDGFQSVRTIYTNLHTKIFPLKERKIRKNTNSKGAMTSLQHLTSIVSL